MCRPDNKARFQCAEFQDTPPAGDATAVRHAYAGGNSARPGGTCQRL